MPARRNSLKHRSKHCLNCGTALDISDRFCHFCGQENNIKRLSLYNYFNEFLGSVITYDSRIVFTLKDLIFKPGTISRNYIAGKRVRYANPFRFFLSVSIIFLLLSNFLNFLKEEFIEDSESEIINTASKPEALNILIDSIFSTNEKDKDYRLIAERDLDTLQAFPKFFTQFELFRSFYKATAIKNPYKALDSLGYTADTFNVWLYRRNSTLDHIEDNPNAFIDYVLGKIPIYLFFFAPILAVIFLFIYFEWYPIRVVRRYVGSRSSFRNILPQEKPKIRQFLIHLGSFLCWPVMIKHKLNYMEHLVFIFHILTFVFLGLLFCLLPDFLLSSSFFTIIFLVIGPFYFYRALRNFYRQNRFLTLFKFFLLNIVFFVLGSMVIGLFFTATAVTY